MDSFSRGTMCRRVPSVCCYFWILYVLVVVVWHAHTTEVRSLYRPLQQQQQQQQQQPRRVVQLTADPRIVGGTPAALGAYPFYVYTIGSGLCGGTLIAPDIVLTAASCEDYFLDGVFIGGLSLDGSDAVEELAVDSTLPHPDYLEATLFNDIMLVKLTNPSTQTVVELNFDPSIPSVGDIVPVIGFGLTSEVGDVSNELLTVNVDIISDNICVDLYPNLVPEIVICAGVAAGGRDACNGDGGGPLLTLDNVQIGIVSFGLGCGQPDTPAIYTEIAAFESFIRNGICDLSDTPPADCVSTTVPVPSPSAAPSPTNIPVATPVATPVVVPVALPIVVPVATPVVVPVVPPVVVPVADPVVVPVANPVVVPVVPPAPVALPVASPIISTVPSSPNTNTTATFAPMMMMGMGMGMGQMMMMGMGMGQMNMNMNMKNDTTIRSTPVAVGISHAPSNDNRNQNNNHHPTNMDIRWKKLLHELNHE